MCHKLVKALPIELSVMVFCQNTQIVAFFLFCFLHLGLTCNYHCYQATGHFTGNTLGK